VPHVSQMQVVYVCMSDVPVRM